MENIISQLRHSKLRLAARLRAQIPDSAIPSSSNGVNDKRQDMPLFSADGKMVLENARNWGP